MQHIGWDHDHHVLWNSHTIDFHRLLADPLNPAPGGEEPEGFVHHHIEILHLCDGVVRGSGLGSGIRMATNTGLQPHSKPPRPLCFPFRHQRLEKGKSQSQHLLHSRFCFQPGFWLRVYKLQVGKTPASPHPPLPCWAGWHQSLPGAAAARQGGWPVRMICS